MNVQPLVVLLLVSTIAVIASLLVVLAPRLMMRRTFFGVSVDPEFRASATAKGILRRYRIRTLAAIALSGVAVAFVSRLQSVLVGLPILLIVVSANVAYVLAWRETKPHASAAQVLRYASLSSTADDTFIGTVWSGSAALMPLACIALYLRANYAAIPARFPTRWDAGGFPNHWSARSPITVFAPLLIGAVIIAFTSGSMLFYRWGAPRPTGRNSRAQARSTRIIVTAICWTISILFGALALSPLHINGPRWIVPVILSAVFLLDVIVIAVAVHASGTRDAEADPTPDSAWKCGEFYANKNDPAMFVPKRTGIGYTINLAHPHAWVFWLGLLALPVIILVLAHAMR